MYHLWCHPVRCANEVIEERGEGGCRGEGLIDGCRDAKVSKLDGAIGVKEDIGGLDVTVEKALGMKVVEGEESVFEEEGDGGLREAKGEGG